jgi:hypothetical protein
MSVGIIWALVKNVLVNDQFQEASLSMAAMALASLSSIPQERWVRFFEWGRQQTAETINEIEILIGRELVFGATGSGLTDADGNSCPDLPAVCNEFAAEIFALKALNQAEKS